MTVGNVLKYIRLLKAANMCSNHGKTLEIICIVDKELLCPMCAIFG